MDVLSGAERRLPWMVSRVEHDDVHTVLAELHPHPGRHRSESRFRGGVHCQGGQGTVGAKAAIAEFAGWAFKETYSIVTLSC